jgi:hypothetical protein
LVDHWNWCSRRGPFKKHLVDRWNRCSMKDIWNVNFLTSFQNENQMIKCIMKKAI